MWVGTIFAYDKDGDGAIQCDNPSEYQLESQVRLRAQCCS